MITPELIIAIIAITIAISASVQCYIANKKMKHIKQDLNSILKDFHNSNTKVRKQVEEILVGNLGLSNKLVSIQKDLSKLSTKQEELSLKDPENKLYSRARKMIELGADINEVVKECEIPLAEAELLFRVQGTPSQSNSNSQSNKTIGNVNNYSFKPIKNTNTNTSTQDNSSNNSSLNESSASIPKEAQAMMQFFNQK